MKSKAEKDALAKVFGVVKRDGMIVNVPKNVPGLVEKIKCTSCTVKLSKGLPTQFAEYMTDEQKAAFKAETGYKPRKLKSEDNRVHGVPENTVEG